MRKNILRYLLFYLLAFLPLQVSAKDFYGFTDEHPLIVACDWDFRPFEFLDGDGEPSGYNVEVLDIILNRLEIPHKFVMQEWQTASDMFLTHQADLIHALSINYKSRPFIQTKKYVNYYNVRAARRVDAPPFEGINKSNRGITVGVKKIMQPCFSVNWIPFSSMCSISHPRRASPVSLLIRVTTISGVRHLL